MNLEPTDTKSNISPEDQDETHELYSLRSKRIISFIIILVLLTGTVLIPVLWSMSQSNQDKSSHENADFSSVDDSKLSSDKNEAFDESFVDIGAAQVVQTKPKNNVNLVKQPIPNLPVAQIYRPELDLLENMLRTLQKGKQIPRKSGEKDGSFFTYTNIDSSSIRGWMDTFQKEEQIFDAPQDLQDVFTSDTAFDEMYEILIAARKEYLSLLHDYGIHRDLIEEIDFRVFPPDKEHLWLSHSSDMYKEFSFVDEIDYSHEKHRLLSEAYMRFEAGNALLGAIRVHQSGLLGAEPKDPQQRVSYWKQARELGLRKTFFHEMTHVMQIAYRNLVAKSFSQKEMESMSKLNWGMEKFFPESYFWDPKQSMLIESDNYVIAMEGVATLFEQKMMTDLYQFNQDQAQVHLDYLSSGTRVDWPRNKLRIIKPLATGESQYVQDTQFLERYFRYILEPMPESEEKKFLQSIGGNLSPNAIASYEGYCVRYDENAVRSIIENLKKKPWGKQTEM